MKKQDVVSLVILAVLCVLSMANIIWMVITNHPDLAIGSAIMFSGSAVILMNELPNKER